MSVNTINGSMSSSMLSMLSQSQEQRKTDLFNKVDSNGSGSIDKAEFSDFAKKLAEMSGSSINADQAFSAYDANGDGSLSANELDKFMKDNAPAPPSGGMQSMEHGPDNLFSKIDGDSSGGISKSEFSKFADKMSQDSGTSINADTVFSTYDTNNDGTLSKDELGSFMKDNAPAPPSSQMQKAMSAYDSSSGSNQISQLLDSLTSSASSSDASSTNNNVLQQLISMLQSNMSSVATKLSYISISA
jgi:Ca2+-binding EF-hand superfamily protein